MSDLDHEHDELGVFDAVHDSVGTLPDAVPIEMRGQLLATSRFRIISEPANPVYDLLPDLAGLDRFDLLRGRCLEANAIFGHGV